MKLSPSVRAALVVMLILGISLHVLAARTPFVSAQPGWPQPWIEIDWDRNENGQVDDWRDVEYAYFQYDDDYLYLKLKCYNTPGTGWPERDGRYKWFIDLDSNLYFSGGNMYDAEYLVFVEDTNHDGVGAMYVVPDIDNNNNFGEYEPWPPTNWSDHEIADPNVGGWRVVTPYQIEFYISWGSVGDPNSYGLYWSTDQQNPNLDQAPTADRMDETQVIEVHDVAAIGQVPTPTIVQQGENVSIQVTVENQGTQVETFNVTCYFNNTELGTKLVANLAVGSQTAIPFEWNTTGVPIGNYSIKSWADSSAAITETDEGDNWCTAPAVVTVQLAPVHDVAATSQIPDRASALQGATVNVNVTISNLGDFSETFNVTCFYGSNPIGYQTLTDLPQKTSTNAIFPWNTTGVQPGTYSILAMADSSNAISEVDETNNNCTSFQAITIFSTSQMGNISVDKFKTGVIIGDHPPVVGFTTTYELTIIVANIGGSNVSNVLVNESISSDVVFDNVGTPSQGFVTALPPPKIVWNVGTLAPNASATLIFTVNATPTSLSLLYLNHKEDIIATGIDTLSGHPVSDTGNTDVTVKPVLRDVAAISQVPTSSIVCQGDTVAIQVTVKNLGNITASFDVTCYYDGNPIGVMRVLNLVGGHQTMISFAWDTSGIAPGNYSITAMADSSHEIAESNETNNVCTSLCVVEVVIHDVAIISQAPSPTLVNQGEVITVVVVLKNEGTEPETFNVSCYRNETLMETQVVTNLPPNATTTLYFLWNTTGATPGTYFFNTEATTVPGEKDTDDNACQSTTSATVNPRYYLTVSSPYGTHGGEGWYDSGDTAYATLDTGLVDHGNGTRRVFIHWGGDASGTDYVQSDPITMDANKTAVAVWKTQYYLTVGTDPYGIAVITGEGWYDKSTSASLDAPDALGYVFKRWEVDSVSKGVGNNPILLHMNDAHTAIAYYERVYGGLSVSVELPPLWAWMAINAIFLVVALVFGQTKRRRRKETN